MSGVSYLFLYGSRRTAVAIDCFFAIDGTRFFRHIFLNVCLELFFSVITLNQCVHLLSEAGVCMSGVSCSMFVYGTRHTGRRDRL